MENIRVSKNKLLEILKKNKQLHREIFIGAQKVYRNEVISVLDKMLAEARAGKNIKHNVDLIAPEDHSGDYDRVIQMLELALDDTITLSERDVQQYVMDKWSWSHGWAASNVQYTGGLYGEGRFGYKLSDEHAKKLAESLE